MRSRILTIIIAGMTIGFLLALGVISLLRALPDGEDPKLSIAFTIFMMFLAGSLSWYVAKTTTR